MGFREFVQMLEAGGLMIGTGGQWNNPPPLAITNNKDPNNHKPTGQGSAVAPAGASTAGLFSGSGPGLGNQQVKRSKKK